MRSKNDPVSSIEGKRGPCADHAAPGTRQQAWGSSSNSARQLPRILLDFARQ
jgi:hypothetical protein